MVQLPVLRMRRLRRVRRLYRLQAVAVEKLRDSAEARGGGHQHLRTGGNGGHFTITYHYCMILYDCLLLTSKNVCVDMYIYIYI